MKTTLMLIAFLSVGVLAATPTAQASGPLLPLFDNTPDVVRFAETLESVCVSTIEAGDMTKDLALLVGPNQKHLTTEQFMDKLIANLNVAMRKAA